MADESLVTIARLMPVKRELHERIARQLPDIPLDPGEAGDALAWSLLFEHWPDLLPGAALARDVAFYNRYFWFKRFITLKQQQDGHDAGLEQNLFQMLEHADFEVDWGLIERLDGEAARLSH